MSLQSITRFTNDNLGGILELRIARSADIDLIPDPVDGVVFGDIEFKPGKTWVIWQAIPESSSATSLSRPSREGSTKTNRLPFLIAKDRASVRTILELAEDEELIVLFKDGNGTQKLFGLLEYPVKLQFDHNSGALHSELNHYKCEFYFDGPDNIFEYNGEVSSAPTGTPPAVVMYNGSPIASLSPGEVLNIESDFGFTDFYITSS
jgi:hypothetical protein